MLMITFNGASRVFSSGFRSGGEGFFGLAGAIGLLGFLVLGVAFRC